MTDAGEPPASMVMTRIGGRDYPLRSIPQCKTCQSPHRLYIENEIMVGRSYRSIAKSLEGMPEGSMGHPSGEGISEHVKNNHIPIGAATHRRIVERRAKEIGRNVDEADETLIDHVTVNQMIVQQGFERIARGELAIDAKDVVAASKFLHQVEQEAGGGLDQQAWQDALMAYMEVAQQFIPVERLREYGTALSKHPVLRAIAAAQEKRALEAAGEADDDEVYEGEVVG